MTARRFRDMRLTEDEAALSVRIFVLASGEMQERYNNDDDYERLIARVKRLLPIWRELGIRAQLAWTSVSEGLPTEPGSYELYDSLRRFTGWLTCFELRAETKRPWIDDEGYEWTLAEFEWHARSLYTHYRRIELPEATS
jgi:hypothetical protein